MKLRDFERLHKAQPYILKHMWMKAHRSLKKLLWIKKQLFAYEKPNNCFCSVKERPAQSVRRKYVQSSAVFLSANGPGRHYRVNDIIWTEESPGLRAVLCRPTKNWLCGGSSSEDKPVKKDFICIYRKKIGLFIGVHFSGRISLSVQAAQESGHYCWWKGFEGLC